MPFCILTFGMNAVTLWNDARRPLQTRMLRTLSPRMKEIAKAHGLVSAPPDVAVRAFRRFLAETITRQGSMTGAAEELGLAPAQINNWCNDLDIHRKVKRTTRAHVVAVLQGKSQGERS